MSAITATQDPTELPTTGSPTGALTIQPTRQPTGSPSQGPSASPTGRPSQPPTPQPTNDPTQQPTPQQTLPPTLAGTTSSPTATPTTGPSQQPSPGPSLSPTLQPSPLPTSGPSPLPTQGPTTSPSVQPTPLPSSNPTPSPTDSPSQSPTQRPSLNPTERPSQSPTDPSQAIVYGLQPNCNFDDPTRFNICLDLVSVSGQRETWMDGFQVARDRWEELITGDDGLAPLTFTLDPDVIATALPPAVDDVYISGFEVVIDGDSGVVGVAGPTALKIVGDKIQSWAGFMEFDQADIRRLEADGIWSRIVLHEMAHVLGFGTLWELNNIYDGLDSGSDVYRGASANLQWDAIGCTGDLPVELDGGPGTAGGHWDEECLVDELMTGTFFGNGPSYLSRLTVASLEDLGYTVDINAADDFNISLLGTCGSYCNNRRSLRRNLNTRKRTPISEQGLKKIYAKAYESLKNKQHHAPDFIPEDHVFVGGDFITVWIEEDGELKDKTVTWTEAEAFVKKDELGTEQQDNVFDH